MTGVRQIAASFGITALLCLGAAAEAKAEVLGTIDDLTYVARSAGLANASGSATTTRRLTAPCPTGTEPVGGGTGVSGNPLRSYVSTTAPGADGWTSAGWHFDAPQAEVTSWGICSSEAQRFRVRSTMLSVGADTSTTATALCGQNAAVSGGISPAGSVEEWWLGASNPVDGDPDADTEPDDAWLGSVYHRPGFPLTSISFLAVCREGPLPTYEAAGLAFSTLRTVTARAKCPGRKSVIGGGPDAAALAADVHVSSSGPIDLRDDDEIPDDGWSATFANPARGEHDFVVQAVCV